MTSLVCKIRSGEVPLYSQCFKAVATNKVSQENKPFPVFNEFCRAKACYHANMLVANDIKSTELGGKVQLDLWNFTRPYFADVIMKRGGNIAVLPHNTTEVYG